MYNSKQLVVVQQDHWMMSVLCQYKREQHEKLWGQLQGNRGQYVQALLSKNKHAPVTSPDDAYRIKNSTVAVASIYSRLWPDYEPLLIEVALTRCLFLFTHEGGKPNDVNGFEAFLLSKLQGDRDDGWFRCQFFIDSLDMLALSPYSYKTRISNPAVRDLISWCIVDSRGDTDARNRLLVERMAKEKNRAAFEGWTAWMGEEMASVGSPRRPTGDQHFYFLRELVMNTTELHPDKPAYFPVVVQVTNAAASSEMLDHYGYILPKLTSENWYFPGFMYFAPKPPRQ